MRAAMKGTGIAVCSRTMTLFAAMCTMGMTGCGNPPPQQPPPPPVTVEPSSTLKLSMESGTVLVGGALSLSATLLTDGKEPVDVTARATWESSVPAAATVAAGVVTGRAPGSALITARLEGLRAYAVVEARLVTIDTSPSHGESDVALFRKTVVRFSAPLSVDARITGTTMTATANGAPLAARVHLAPDRRSLTLFYKQLLPPASSIRVTLAGDDLLDETRHAVDVDGDGTAGGRYEFEFSTVNVTPVPGTSMSGRVFASELADKGGGAVNKPLPGVAITIDGVDPGKLSAVTDMNGNFHLEPVPAGAFFVHIDGQTVKGAPAGAYYPFIGKLWESTAGTDTMVPDIFLPLIPDGTLRQVSETSETAIDLAPQVVAQHPELAGVKVTVPAKSLMTDGETYGGKVGIAPVPSDRLPEPLPPDLRFPIVITVQTDGPSNFDVPAPACFPNLPDPVTKQALPPGSQSALWSFSHDKGKFEIVGPMTVSADGRLVCTDAGVGIRAPGWHATLPGATLGGAAEVPCDKMPARWRAAFADANTLSHSVVDSLVSGMTGALYSIGGRLPSGSYGRMMFEASQVMRSSAACAKSNMGGDCIQMVGAFLGGVGNVTQDIAGTIGDRARTWSKLGKAIGQIGSVFSVVSNTRNLMSAMDTLNAETKRLADCNGGAFASQDALVAAATADLSKLEQSVDVAKPAIEAIDQNNARLSELGRKYDENQPNGGWSEVERTEIADILNKQADSADRLSTGPDLIDPAQEVTKQFDTFVVSTAPQSMQPCTRAFVKVELGGQVFRLRADGAGRWSIRGATNNAARVLVYCAANNVVGSGYGQTGGNGSQIQSPPTYAVEDIGLVDTDQDGLPDKVEDIIGTRADKADTDGDGVDDGTEVRLGRNPLDGVAQTVGVIAATKIGGTAVDLCATGDIVVTAAKNSGVIILNAYRGQPPVTIARVATPADPVAVACARDSVSAAVGGAGLIVIDASRPAGAQVLHTVALGAAATSVATDGVHSYVGLDSGEVAAVALSDGRVRARTQVGAAVQDVAISRGAIYALTAFGFHALSFDGAALKLENSLKLATTPETGHRDRLFVGADSAVLVATGGYRTVDLAVPLAPRLIAGAASPQAGWRHLALDGTAVGVAAVGQSAQPSTPHHVSLYDVSDPTRTDRFTREIMTTGASASSVVIARGVAYIADGEAGVTVVRYREPDARKTPPTVALSLSQLGGSVVEGRPAALTAVAGDDVQVSHVEFYVDGQLVDRDVSDPFETTIIAPAASMRPSIKVKARAVDVGGNEAWSQESTLAVMPFKCAPGREDCDGNAITGCEADVSADVNNCGGCGRRCSFGDTCIAGQCECMPGIADCGGKCVDLKTDGANCGACGMKCAPGTRCRNSACAPCMVFGLVDCGGSCVDPVVDDKNCGACGNACAGGRRCVAGQCVLCNGGGFTDCGGKCADLSTDANNCGACGAACSTSHAVSACVTGVCRVTSCSPGWADCDGMAGNGCESDLATDAANCGACKAACSFNHVAMAACAGGACTSICAMGWSDCDNNKRSNGCEVNTDQSVTNCGGCGVVCSTNNITRVCAGDNCNAGVCSAGFADCNGNKQSDGCEVDVRADPMNCGGCGVSCSWDNVIKATCGAGRCTSMCSPGFADCNNNVGKDGCEVALGNDPRNCSQCGVVCSNNHIRTPTCAGVCNGACDAGYDDCNSDKLADGCETQINGSDPRNCGKCRQVCSYNRVMQPSCAGGICDSLCRVGSADCNGDKLLDGCEVSIFTDRSNCGACGNVCKGDEDCVSGLCKKKDGGACAQNVDCAGGLCKMGACAAPTLGLQLAGTYPTVTAIALAAADFNRDGKIDLAVKNASSLLGILLGNGDGSFQAMKTFSVCNSAGGPDSLVATDVNGDSLLDLIVGCTSGPPAGVAVILGNGDGSFQSRVFYSVEDSMGVAVADVDLDGKLDIVSAQYYPNTVGVLIGRGDGSFKTAVTYACPKSPRALLIDDLTQDGYADLLVAGDAGDIGMLAGNGDGTFQATRTTAIGSEAVSLASGDFNGDGKADAAIALNVQNVAAVLIGVGGGAFQVAKYAAGLGTRSVAIRDLNGDGRLDLIVANGNAFNVPNADTFSVFLGTGIGTFQPQVLVDVPGKGIYDVATADLNGDGKPDVVTANANTTNVSVFLNTSK